jgi:hypothetical protein
VHAGLLAVRDRGQCLVESAGLLECLGSVDAPYPATAGQQGVLGDVRLGRRLHVRGAIQHEHLHAHRVRQLDEPRGDRVPADDDLDELIGAGSLFAGCPPGQLLGGQPRLGELGGAPLDQGTDRDVGAGGDEPCRGTREAAQEAQLLQPVDGGSHRRGTAAQLAGEFGDRLVRSHHERDEHLLVDLGHAERLQHLPSRRSAVTDVGHGLDLSP